jgi:hypothetical protein
MLPCPAESRRQQVCTCHGRELSQRCGAELMLAAPQRGSRPGLAGPGPRCSGGRDERRPRRRARHGDAAGAGADPGHPRPAPPCPGILRPAVPASLSLGSLAACRHSPDQRLADHSALAGHGQPRNDEPALASRWPEDGPLHTTPGNQPLRTLRHTLPPICTVGEEEPRVMVSRRTRCSAHRFMAHPTLFRPRVVGRARNPFLKAAGLNSRTIQKTG